MSCCGPALTEEEKKAQERSKTLDEETKKDAESSEEVVKLLFLGCGDSVCFLRLQVRVHMSSCMKSFCRCPGKVDDFQASD